MQVFRSFLVKSRIRF